MILNAIQYFFKVLRALVIGMCRLAHGCGGTLLINRVGFVPNTRAGHCMGIFMTGIVIVTDVSVWVMSGFGFIVRKYQDWFFHPERKPPDKQNEWERSERRRLRMG